MDKAIGVCHTFVLTQMLDPRGDEECLDYAPFFSGVLEYFPSIRAIASALVCEFFKRLKESFAILQANAICLDKHWTSVAVDRLSCEGCRPVHGGG